MRETALFKMQQQVTIDINFGAAILLLEPFCPSRKGFIHDLVL